MKAITVHPMIGFGISESLTGPYVVRTSSTKYRGPLLIHAASTFKRHPLQTVFEHGEPEAVGQALRLRPEIRLSNLSSLIHPGQIIARAELVGVKRIDADGPNLRPWQHATEGQWLWTLENVVKFIHGPHCSGSAGVWNFDS